MTPHWEGIRRFPIRHAMTIRPGLGDKPPFGISDMGSAHTLDDFLSWAQDKFPAKQYMLIIWGHGNGLPFLDAERLNAHSPSGIEPCPSTGDWPGTTKGVFVDDGSEKTLYNREIANILRKLDERGKKLRIIGFDACLMGNIETANALAHVADIMVASEALVSACSWSYAYPLLKLAGANGQVDARTLSKLFVEGYGLKYRGTNRTLSAVGCGRMKSPGRCVCNP